MWNLNDRQQQQQPTLSHSDIFNFYSTVNPDLLHANNFRYFIFMLSSCSTVISGSSLSLLSLYPSFEQCTERNLSWERDRAPAWATSRTQCWAVLEALAMLCVSQVASLNSQQPESRWKMGLETTQPDRCTHDMQCWMQPWWIFWFLGGDSGHNYGSLSPKSFLSGPKSYCTSRLQMSCCFCWTTLGLMAVFSVKSSFLQDPPCFLFSY